MKISVKRIKPQKDSENYIEYIDSIEPKDVMCLYKNSSNPFTYIYFKNGTYILADHDLDFLEKRLNI